MKRKLDYFKILPSPLIVGWLLVHRRICPTNGCQRTCKGHNRRTNYRCQCWVKGATMVTTLIFTGNFLLSANEDDLIVISFIGYLT